MMIFVLGIMIVLLLAWVGYLASKIAELEQRLSGMQGNVEQMTRILEKAYPASKYTPWN